MIGVTIASEKFEKLAMHACKRFRRNTGINKTYTISTEYEKNYREKLGLWRLIQDGETVVFFDSDLWFIRNTNLSIFENRNEVIACHDPGCRSEFSNNHFPYRDAMTFGIDPDRYFNGGFMVFNHRHISALKFAEEIMLGMSKKKGRKYIDGMPLADFGEQSSINYAMVKFGIPVDIVSAQYNFMPF